MKKLIFLSLLAFGLLSCGGGSADNANSNPAPAPVEKKQGPEYTSKYICPMHCKGSGAAAEGQCPVCGMDYVVNDNWQDPHAGHNH